MSASGPVATTLRAGTSVTGGRWDAGAGKTGAGEFVLDLRHDETGATHEHVTEGLVLATGYQPEVPGFLDPVRHLLRWDERGRFDVAQDWSVDHDHRVFVQNAEQHVHGFVAPDLGMGAWRSSSIVNTLAGREVYRMPAPFTFQQFGPPAGARAELDVEHEAGRA